MADTDEIGAWLLGEGRRLSSPADLLAGLCRALGEAGIPVHRSTLGAPLLRTVIFIVVRDTACPLRPHPSSR